MKIFRYLVLITILLSFPLLALAGNNDAGVFGDRNTGGVNRVYGIGDKEGDTADVNDSGQLEVHVTGITGDFTATSLTVTEVTAGVDADNLCKAEDAAHTTAEHGVFMLSVRSDAAATTAGTDADYAALITGAAGHLWVDQKGTVAEDAVHSSGAIGLTTLGVRNDALAALAGTDGDNAVIQVGAEGAVFVMGDQVEDTAASGGDYLMPIAAVRNDALAALAGTDGDYSTLQVCAEGGLFVTGNKAEDAAHTTGDYGMPILAVRQDAQAALAGTSGDYSPLSVNASGELVVALSGVAATNYGKAEDAAHTTGDVGIMNLSVRADTAAATAATTGDYQPIITDANGRLHTVIASEVAEDAVHASSATGIQTLSVRNDVLAALAGTDGDYSPFQVNDIGAVYTTGEHAEDAAHVSGDYGNLPLAVRNDTIAALGGTDGDFAPFQVDATGYLATSDAAGFSEDAAHTTADEGLQILAVRNDALAALSGTDGDYSPIQVNAEGAVFVAGDQVEDTAASDGDYAMPILAVRNDVLAALGGTDGDYTTLQVSAEGALFVVGDQVEDTAAGDGDYGNQILAVRDDAPLAAKAGTTGDYSPLSVDDVGHLYTRDMAEKVEDVAHSTGDPGLYILSHRLDTLASSAGTTADYASFVTGAEGALYVMGDQVEDTAASDGDYLMPIAAVRNDVLAALATADGDYSTVQVDAEGALFVVGDKAEDAAHTTADYLLPIATQRLDVAASSAGTTADYATLNTNSLGKVYVSQLHASPTVTCSTGDLNAGVDVVAAGAGGVKNRIYKITVCTLAAEVITVTELSGFTTINTAAGVPQVWDFGEEGLLQTTAATAINFDSADASSATVAVTWSQE